MMTRIAAILLMAVFLAGAAAHGAEDKRGDPTQLFYTANHYYEKRDYTSAIDEYLKILDRGVENGRVYYNIGNGFLKLGKVGYAILCYEKARQFIPQDSDLRANLAYAKSLTEGGALEPMYRNIVVRALYRFSGEYSLNTLAYAITAVWLLVVIIATGCIMNPYLTKKLWAVQAALILLLAVGLSGFAVRYYDEEILRRGVVVQKEAVCRYEPIDTSTTYYTLREGGSVVIMKTKNDWRQIRRYDGKIGWVKKDAVESI